MGREQVRLVIKRREEIDHEEFDLEEGDVFVAPFIGGIRYGMWVPIEVLTQFAQEHPVLGWDEQEIDWRR